MQKILLKIANIFIVLAILVVIAKPRKGMHPFTQENLASTSSKIGYVIGTASGAGMATHDGSLESLVFNVVTAVISLICFIVKSKQNPQN